MIGVDMLENGSDVLLIYRDLLKKIQYSGLIYVVVDLLRNGTMTLVVVRRQLHQ